MWYLQEVINFTLMYVLLLTSFVQLSINLKLKWNLAFKENWRFILMHHTRVILSRNYSIFRKYNCFIFNIIFKYVGPQMTESYRTDLREASLRQPLWMQNFLAKGEHQSFIKVFHHVPKFWVISEIRGGRAFDRPCIYCVLFSTIFIFTF